VHLFGFTVEIKEFICSIFLLSMIETALRLTQPLTETSTYNISWG